ncbi:alpha/beta fold hydrolase [Rhabdothermincola sediminis]|uniref:alpha/beta fold hydrolase n=1 Tax=Rhabdothermincola sediminis TaxID=2751370 RepID=UPI001AA090B7|nr:alpha/beta fold hydrolase [Rhabdothermincola sediminis]
MAGQMLGMNPDEVEELGRQLQSHAERLRSLVSQITGNVMSTGWVGPDATRFTHEWWPATRAQIIACAEDLHGFGQSALNNATEQRRASGVGDGTEGLPGWVGRTGSIEQSGEKLFQRFHSTRESIVQAMLDSRETGRNEIQIRRLDNEKFIVVLPGVVDLSQGLKNPLVAPAAWMTTQEDTARLMRNAIGEWASPGGYDTYAAQVKQAMERAGVPAGADVLLVGHSYGGFAAMNLATDPSFNSAVGSTNATGYHVNVTHVVAAGADTEHYLSRVPKETHALVFNNRYDVVYQAEDQGNDRWLDRNIADWSPHHPNHLALEFNGRTTWADGSGYGHDVPVYATWLQQATDHPRLASWLDSASGYAEGGYVSNHRVPTPR